MLLWKVFGQVLQASKNAERRDDNYMVEHL
jgi:hypothetical protein